MRIPVITHQPRVTPRALLKGPGSFGGAAWTEGRLFARGRDALHWAFRLFRREAWRVAWFPSFHCGVEVEAAVAAGFEVAFYPVGVDLSPDLGDFRTRFFRDPGPVTVIHYFGHPLPGLAQIAEICRASRTPLIEDACHGPTGSGGLLRSGTVGDAVAFSLRKILGTPDGGVLALRREGMRHLFPGGGVDLLPRLPRALWPFLDYGRRVLGRGRNPPPAPSGPGSGDALPGHEDPRAPREDYGRGISLLSQRIAAHCAPQLLFRRRRENWEMLRTMLEGTSGFAPVFPALEDGAVPLSFAVRVARREALVRTLLEKGVDSHTFGRYPHPLLDLDAFPEAAHLRAEILGLPVHQGLEAEEIERMAEALRRVLPPHRWDA